MLAGILFQDENPRVATSLSAPPLLVVQ